MQAPARNEMLRLNGCPFSGREISGFVHSDGEGSPRLDSRFCNIPANRP